MSGGGQWTAGAEDGWGRDLAGAAAARHRAFYLQADGEEQGESRGKHRGEGSHRGEGGHDHTDDAQPSRRGGATVLHWAFAGAAAETGRATPAPPFC